MPKMQYNGALVPNMMGVYKKFKDPYSKTAELWRRSTSKTEPQTKRVKLTAEEKAQRKADRIKLQMKHDRWLYEKAQDAFAYAMDGGHPHDRFRVVFERYNLTMDDVDKVLRKIDKTKKGFYAQLAEMWSDTQGDQLHDAKNGHIDDNNQFYRVIDGEIIPEDNPWG